MFPLLKFFSIRLNFILFGAAFLVLSPICFASQTSSTPRLEERLGKLFAAAEYVINQIDPAVYDLKALQQSIGTSAEELTQWVRSNTAWVPYQGALKGAQGTLLARQGNLVDRTLLLGSLLEAAGYDTQIGRAEASDALRKIMRQAVKAQRTRPGPKMPEEISSDHVREIAQVTGLSEAEIWAGIEQQSKTAVRFEQEHTVTLEEHFKAIRHALETSLKPKSFEPWDDALTKFTGFSIAITPSRNGDMATWWTTFHLLWSGFLCQRRDHQRAARSTVTPLSSSPPTPVYYCARCYGFTTVTSSPLKENSYLW